ncbi:MAG: hypothetical protein ACE5IR_28000 [bacterium]
MLCFIAIPGIVFRNETTIHGAHDGIGAALGMIPMLFSTGIGSEVLRPLATFF